MTYLDELEGAFARHFSELAKRWQWVARPSETFPTGARLEYVAGNVRVRVVNERRLLYVEVGPVAAPETSFTVSQVKDLLEPARRGRWSLSLSDSADFLERRWELLDREFSVEQFDDLVHRLSTRDGG